MPLVEVHQIDEVPQPVLRGRRGGHMTGRHRPALVATAIAQALSLREEGVLSLVDLLASFREEHAAAAYQRAVAQVAAA